MKAMLFVLTLALLLRLAGREPLANRISYADPTKYRHTSFPGNIYRYLVITPASSAPHRGAANGR